MTESTPPRPYELVSSNSMPSTLKSLKNRREEMNNRLTDEDLQLSSITMFPGFGMGKYFHSSKEDLNELGSRKDIQELNDISKGNIILDGLCGTHPRMQSLMKNAVDRRKSHC